MTELRFAICVENEGYEASLEVRKVYELLEDVKGESHGMLRVVDESGDDYLFPEHFFVPIDLPTPIRERLTSLV
jgi:hypothetical protein